MQIRSRCGRVYNKFHSFETAVSPLQSHALFPTRSALCCLAWALVAGCRRAPREWRCSAYCHSRQVTRRGLCSASPNLRADSRGRIGRLRGGQRRVATLASRSRTHGRLWSSLSEMPTSGSVLLAHGHREPADHLREGRPRLKLGARDRPECAVRVREQAHVARAAGRRVQPSIPTSPSSSPPSSSITQHIRALHIYISIRSARRRRTHHHTHAAGRRRRAERPPAAAVRPTICATREWGQPVVPSRYMTVISPLYDRYMRPVVLSRTTARRRLSRRRARAPAPAASRAVGLSPPPVGVAAKQLRRLSRSPLRRRPPRQAREREAKYERPTPSPSPRRAPARGESTTARRRANTRGRAPRGESTTARCRANTRGRTQVDVHGDIRHPGELLALKERRPERRRRLCGGRLGRRRRRRGEGGAARRQLAQPHMTVTGRGRGK